jgi:hypothetical protein
MRRVHVLLSGALAVVVTAGCLVGSASSASTASSNVVAASDAASLGSLGGAKLAHPIVGMAASPSGLGYWLVGSDGGVFTFGDAGFFGSLGGVRLARPIVGMAASRSGEGYWLVGADGGVFAFGDAGFFGSLAGATLAHPIVGMAASPSGEGYWLVGSDGRVFAFGDAGSRYQSPPPPTFRGTSVPSRIIPNFKPPVPGAPIIRARLDDTGLHFNPSRIASGIYNVAFSDTRSDRLPGTDVALHIYVSGPGYSMLSVHAGETGGGLLCWGAVSAGVTVNGYDFSGGELTIDPSPACATPVT